MSGDDRRREKDPDADHRARHDGEARERADHARGCVGDPLLHASEVLVLASLKAADACQVGESLAGRLLLFDALHTTFDEVAIRKNPDCPVCGDHPTITEYIDYVEFCSRGTVTA